jgi:peptidoglycan/xylan/chitin deacetylase (PgdA/CDA1 family)
MKDEGEKIPYVSPATATGFISIALSCVLFFFHAGLAAIPLGVFVFLCVSAPFFPSRGFFLPVFSRGHTGKPFVSLTFDDGPDPLTTRPLLQLLERHNAKACFFVTGERAALYGNLIKDILEPGHDIGNHSYHHDPLLMLRRTTTLYREIESAQLLLRHFGISPAAFRPPVGATNPRLANVLLQQKLYCINFTCRAFDGGNSNVHKLSERILKKVKPDDIILLHDVRPKEEMHMQIFLHEVDLILSGLKKKGLQVVPLAELLGRPVMSRIKHDQ